MCHGRAAQTPSRDRTPDPLLPKKFFCEPQVASCLIGLGANLDAPETTLLAALQQLDDAPQVGVIAHSETIRTEPIGPPGQSRYCNAAAVLETTLSPERLLQTMHDIEARLGRRRHLPWTDDGVRRRS